MASPVRVSAGKGDGVDEGMFGQELAGGVRPETVHDVVDALGNADLVHDFAEQSGGERGFLGGFDHHCVAAGERRADLPGHQKVAAGSTARSPRSRLFGLRSP